MPELNISQKVYSRIDGYDVQVATILKDISLLYEKPPSMVTFTTICDKYAVLLNMSREMNTLILGEVNFTKLSQQVKIIEMWEPISDMASFYIEKVQRNLKKYEIKSISAPGIKESVKYVESNAGNSKYVSLTEITKILRKHKRVNGPRSRVERNESSDT